MSIADIIVLIVVTILLGLIIYFNIIRPKIKKESGCHNCPYSKQCKGIENDKKRQCENLKRK